MNGQRGCIILHKLNRRRFGWWIGSLLRTNVAGISATMRRVRRTGDGKCNIGCGPWGLGVRLGPARCVACAIVRPVGVHDGRDSGSYWGCCYHDEESLGKCDYRRWIRRCTPKAVVAHFTGLATCSNHDI
ncbi:hypothetical protein V6N12_051023 [Hibiscus sabdariffa]|uniref:Uncharacterized protein n=1 Tax=Hibiscus sabdariffa TaxID=183260 RepID=A0ABR2GEY3_9ROSI